MTARRAAGVQPTEGETAEPAASVESRDWIRGYYRAVPAGLDVGWRVRADRKDGTVMGFRSGYLRVLLDGDRHQTTWHATWRMEYLGPPGDREHLTWNAKR